MMHQRMPHLPPPTSWYPGHMTRFTRMLPTLLNKTDIVLELRDSRLPLTSINRNLEGALQQWRLERGRPPRADPFQRSSAFESPSLATSTSTALATMETVSSSSTFALSTEVQPPMPGAKPCEHIVIFNKRDLVPKWGIEPFRRAMASRFPDQRIMFASWRRSQDIRVLNELLINIAKQHPWSMELNVLVLGMPNVGKSTLLNALRHTGIAGPTAKALQTSANPGHTRAVSNRLKINESPLVYAYDSPGVMLPFLGHGQRGAERGVKLALIAGIKEGLYDVEALASYLLYRLNVLNPIAPTYLDILPPGTLPLTEPSEFLEALARRLGMVRKHDQLDVARAAMWFVRWWRAEGCLKSAAAPNHAAAGRNSVLTGKGMRQGWGFDFEWDIDVTEGLGNGPMDVQAKMERCVDEHLKETIEEERDGGVLSTTQMKKKAWDEKIAKRMQKSKARLAARRGGS